MIDTFAISLPLSEKICNTIANSIDKDLKNGKSHFIKDYSKSSRLLFTEHFASSGFLEIAFHRFKQQYFLKLKLKPICFIYEGEFIELAKSTDFKHFEKVFNSYMDSWISGFRNTSFLHLSNWKLDRIDYAVNYKTDNIRLLLFILHRGNIPAGFKYHNYSQSLYLTSDAVNINFYDKVAQLQNIYHLNPYDFPYSKGILRFEVQCKSDEIYRLNKKFKLYNSSLSSFWNPKIASYVIKNRIKSIIGTQDFFNVEFAKSIFQKKYKKIPHILYAILYHIQYSLNLQSAKESFLQNFPYFSSNQYDKYLVKIRKCNVNPIPISISYSDQYDTFPNPYNYIDSLIR